MDALKNILITGASGLIGTRLTEMLIGRNHHVSHLGRSKKAGNVPSFVWDVDNNKLDEDALTNVDTIVHLAGASVGEKRWTNERKNEILESRIRSTRLLFETLRKGNHKVTSFVSASAIGYYGFESDGKFISEQHPAGTDFLASVTRQWEEETEKITGLGLRTVKLRIGIVLSEKGGALKQMATPVKFLVGAPLGSGNQYISWIHLDDLCNMFIKAIQDSNMRGAYNAVAPNPVTNRELTKVIASALKKPLILPPVPKFALAIILGEMAEIVVTGSKISPEKIMKEGFQYQYTRVEDAVRALLTK
jgi:uncharacterized protein (TIGR01777 family)